MSNRDIIESFYRHHRDELLTFVDRRLGVASSLAADMVQDIFLRLLSDGHRVITASTLGSLVYTMARNLIADHYRHLYYQRLHAALVQASAQEDYTIEPAIYAREAIGQIERRLQRLPQSTAEIYRLHLYGGMKVSEISNCLHQDYKAVEYRLGQARREVRHLLAAGI